MKPNQPKFWCAITVIYMVFLFVVMLFFGPNFSESVEILFMLPLYPPIFIASILQHKNEPDDSKNRWTIRFFAILVTLVVVLFKITIGYIR